MALTSLIKPVTYQITLDLYNSGLCTSNNNILTRELNLKPYLSLKQKAQSFLLNYINYFSQKAFCFSLFAFKLPLKIIMGNY